MKKFFAIICALFMLFTVTAVVAVAETTDAVVPADTSDIFVDVPDTTVDVPDINVGEPFTWSYLATIAGAAVFTLLVVQFIKAPLDKAWKIPTRFLAYIISLGTMLVATALTTGLSLDNGLLAAVNALLAAVSAYGMYEVTFAKIVKK